MTEEQVKQIIFDMISNKEISFRVAEENELVYGDWYKTKKLIISKRVGDYNKELIKYNI